MIDPPKRTGYRLTYDAECLYNDWQDIGGCSCHTGGAPCRSCHNDGHPISLEENDEAWELDEGVEDMSRSCITDKSSAPKSEWFGFKYRVTPESSELLQEAVFADGGSWADGGKKVQFTDMPMLYVSVDRKITYSRSDGSYFISHALPEKQPPQSVKVEPTKKDFIVGKWYKCLANTFGFLEGKYYRLGKVQGNLWFDGTLSYVSRGCFDINSESDYDPNPAQPAGYTAYVVFKQDNVVGYGGKEYAYKCSFEDFKQANKQCNAVFAEVNVSGVEKKVKVLRIEAKVDPKATKSIVRILPKELAIEDKESRLGTPKAIIDAANRVVDIVVTKGTDFEVGKHYKPLVGRTHLTQGKYYKVIDMNGNKNCLRVIDDSGDKTYFGRGGFHPVALEDDFLSKDDVNAVIKHFNQQEEVNMSNQRKVVEVQLFDDAKGLPVQDSLVAKFENVLTEDDNDTTIREVIMNNDIKKVLAAHNVKRSKVINQDILERTGNSVALQPVLLKDLRWKVIG